MSKFSRNADTRWKIEHFSTGVHLLSIGVCLLWLLYRSRGLTFFFDEWDFILRRTYSFNDLLRPHNGHLSLLPVLAYNITRSTFGIDSYVPFQILGLLVHGSVCSAVFALGRRRSATVAIVAAVLVCLLGTGWQNIMWPFQIGMMGALSGGLWAIWETTNDEVSVKRLNILCVITLSCAGGGVVAFGAVVVLVIYRRLWKNLKSLVIIGSCYLVWYLKYGASQTVDGNLSKTPQYVYDSLVSSANGIVGNNQRFGYFFLFLLLAALVANIYWRKSVLASAALILMALMTWTLTGLSRAHFQEPAASRYVYVGAIILVTVLVSLFPMQLARYFLLPITLLSIFVIQDNLKILDQGIDGLYDVSQHVRSSLTGLESISGQVNVGESLDASRAPQIDIAQYLEVIRQSGRTGFSMDELRLKPEEIQVEADSALFRLMSGLHTKINKTECGNRSDGVTVVRVNPGRTVILATSGDAEATFRWFTKEIATSAQIQMMPGDYYQITNHVTQGAPSLEISFLGASVVVCD